MGSFEKLGILVIVVIIVMILAVAIHQWGGGGAEATGADGALSGRIPIGSIAPPPGPVDRNLFRSRPPQDGCGEEEGAPLPPSNDMWAGGIPRRYTIQTSDRLWSLVVEKWRLKESFVGAIETANPRLNVATLRAGQVIVIPDPMDYRGGGPIRGNTPDTIEYKIKAGDQLDSIAKAHLGSYQAYKKILELNPGLNARALKPGQVILIPVK